MSKILNKLNAIQRRKTVKKNIKTIYSITMAIMELQMLLSKSISPKPIVVHASSSNYASIEIYCYFDDVKEIKRTITKFNKRIHQGITLYYNLKIESIVFDSRKSEI